MTTYDPELLDALEQIATTSWSGPVWRHMFNDYQPDRVNTSGARWNPPGVGAVYTSLHRETALAEGQHAIDMQPRRTFARRVLYEVQVTVERLVDLTTPPALAAVGLTIADVTSDDLAACQRVGGAAAWLGYDGIQVPSARHPGANLVILIGPTGPESDIAILSVQDVRKS